MNISTVHLFLQFELTKYKTRKIHQISGLDRILTHFEKTEVVLKCVEICKWYIEGLYITSATKGVTKARLIRIDY